MIQVKLLLQCVSVPGTTLVHEEGGKGWGWKVAASSWKVSCAIYQVIDTALGTLQTVPQLIHISRLYFYPHLEDAKTEI